MAHPTKEKKPSTAPIDCLPTPFSEYRSALEKLWEQKTSFRTLCEEYRACLTAMSYWQCSTSEEAPRRRQEYTDVLEALEEEIRQYMEDWHPPLVNENGQRP